MNVSSHHSAVIGTAALLCAVALGGVLLAGCLIIPVDYHAAGSRRNVTMEATNAVHIGVTTQEDVLLALGEPDFVSEDGRRFGYLWTKVKAIWASYGGAGGEFTKSYLIETSFDQRNRLSNVRVRKQWGDSVAGTPEDEGPR